MCSFGFSCIGPYVSLTKGKKTRLHPETGLKPSTHGRIWFYALSSSQPPGAVVVPRDLNSEFRDAIIACEVCFNTCFPISIYAMRYEMEEVKL